MWTLKSTGCELKPDSYAQLTGTSVCGLTFIFRLCPHESCAMASTLTPWPWAFSVPTQFLSTFWTHLDVPSSQKLPQTSQGDISFLVSVLGRPLVTAFILLMPSRVPLSVSATDYEPPGDRTELSASVPGTQQVHNTHCHMILSMPRSLWSHQITFSFVLRLALDHVP